MKGIKGLSRIDSEKKKMHGWYVRVYGGGKTYAKYFSDHRYGGKNKALVTALHHLEKLTKKVEKKFANFAAYQNQPLYWNKPGKSNQSGLVGIHRCETMSHGREVAYWAATWNERGQRKDKAFYFSNKLRTEEEAKRLAIEYRAQKLIELSGGKLAPKKRRGRQKDGEKKPLTTWVPGLVIEDWSPDLSIGSLDYSKEIKKREPLTRKRIDDLQIFLGLASLHFNWEDIDYEFGRGIFKNDIRSRCFWNKEGIRTDVVIENDGRICLHQGTEPDPYYMQHHPELKIKPGRKHMKADFLLNE